jgi:hypothetical protein
LQLGSHAAGSDRVRPGPLDVANDRQRAARQKAFRERRNERGLRDLDRPFLRPP